MIDKRAHGQFYTRGNPFHLKPFRQWAKKAGLANQCVLEPFAGANHIINTLKEMDLCSAFCSYDITPGDPQVQQRDTIADFPKGFQVCVTNPPWLARNSATRRRLPFPSQGYDDLYKHSLELCLKHCEYVAALVPASYLQSSLFQDRLESYLLLHDDIFDDTENPVSLCLFNPEKTQSISIYDGEKCLETYAELSKHLPEKKEDKRVRFNDPAGELGFIAFDNTKEASICFCAAAEIKEYAIKVSSRFRTRISGDLGNVSKLIKRLNMAVDEFREKTHDVFLTPFKGKRSDKKYRRRMEFSMARRFINAD